MLLSVKRCLNQICLTVSAGMCPPLCLRGGLGRTRVTWCRGRPCVGSSDRPSQDAERDSGDEYDGTEGGGEELESSQRPDERIIEDVRTRNWEGIGQETGWGNYRKPLFLFLKLPNLKQLATALRYSDSDLAQARLKQPLTDFSDGEMGKGKRTQQKTH